MNVLMFIVFLISVSFLVFFTSVKPQNTNEAKRSNRRYEMIMPYVLTFQTIIIALFLVMSVLLSVATFGWILGVVVAVILALQYAALARLRFVRTFSQNLFRKYEKQFYVMLDKLRPYMRFVRSINVSDLIESKEISNREELKNMLMQSTVLTPDEKLLFSNGIDFNQKKISEVMTTRSSIKYIEKTEFLGPLVLDNIHKYGHSRLPVIDKDLDHVVGILYLQDLLSLELKKSSSADKIMEKKVYYIHKDQDMEHALAAFIKTKHHLFIVINELRETVGLITLEDAIESLIGRRIEDRFTSHEDKRTVAKRLSNENNKPASHQDV